jgi:hypothetical protein
MTRFDDRGTYAFEFEREFAVRCPKCQHKASVFSEAQGQRVLSAKLSCTSCGYSAQWSRDGYRAPAIASATRSRQSPPSDPHFGFPLWFVGQIKGHVFWAYNAAHLSFIKDYVAATVRIRQPNVNASLASRLPAFLLDRKNRSAVLKRIAGLEQM